MSSSNICALAEIGKRVAPLDNRNSCFTNTTDYHTKQHPSNAIQRYHLFYSHPSESISEQKSPIFALSPSCVLLLIRGMLYCLSVFPVLRSIYKHCRVFGWMSSLSSGHHQFHEGTPTLLYGSNSSTSKNRQQQQKERDWWRSIILQ